MSEVLFATYIKRPLPAFRKMLLPFTMNLIMMLMGLKFHREVLFDILLNGNFFTHLQLAQTCDVRENNNIANKNDTESGLRESHKKP
jgi:hypothetical protein